jgi:hypothetical protein
MIVRRALSSPWPGSRADGVRIVVADQALAVGRMQGQRIADPVGPLRRGSDLLDNHLDPVRAVWIDDEDDAIERKQCVQPRIMSWFWHYPQRLSRDDNTCKGIPQQGPVDEAFLYMIMSFIIYMERT